VVADAGLVGHQGMDEIASLVEMYLVVERHLVAVAELTGGAVALPDGRTVTVGRAEFDRCWASVASERGLSSESQRQCHRTGDQRRIVVRSGSVRLRARWWQRGVEGGRRRSLC
jgi:hypothetical protein